MERLKVRKLTLWIYFKSCTSRKFAKMDNQGNLSINQTLNNQLLKFQTQFTRAHSRTNQN